MFSPGFTVQPTTLPKSPTPSISSVPNNTPADDTTQTNHSFLNWLSARFQSRRTGPAPSTIRAWWRTPTLHLQASLPWHILFHFLLLFNMCTIMCQSHNWHMSSSHLFLLPIVLLRWLAPSTLLWLSAGILIVHITYCSRDIHCSSDFHRSHFSIVPIEYIVRPAK